ncbi:sensor histidine kinase [Nocardia sp. NPDC052566]|uniref:sensor histidine kinase n=1 Tax=Nocardia sp. NPDC052566 TaxID=3364330 RepID=UPI0037C535DF
MDRRWRIDGALIAGLLLLGIGWAQLVPEGHPLDVGGVLLMTAAIVPLLWYRNAALLGLVAHTAVSLVYHFYDYPHEALIPATMFALLTVARYGSRARTTLVVVIVAVIVVVGIWIYSAPNDNTLVDSIGSAGWVLVACVAGEAMRLQSALLATTVERAERAEQARDEEARRQVTEERLRIARDLHDLLAHTITVIQVQAGVAAHLVHTGRADPAVVAAALDTIADACADARTELAATVGVLRAPSPESLAPQPTLAQLPALAGPVEAAGVTVEFAITGAVRPLAATVEMIGYRIVQEALTNVAKHAAATRAEVRLDYGPDRLTIHVTDSGRRAAARETEWPATGFGIRGMCERAEAIGGTVVVAGHSSGFVVMAELPIARQIPAESRAPDTTHTAAMPSEPAWAAS